jgi:Peptidase family M28/PDZ domain/PA domain
MKPYILGIILFVILASSCQQKFNSQITEADLKESLSFLASDSLKGRYPGTVEDSILQAYISDKFETYGLQPYQGSYIQTFNFQTGIEPSSTNWVSFDNLKFEQGKDFVAMAFSGNDSIKAGFVFCGYGFELEEKDFTWNDYANIDVENKWAVILRGEPSNNKAFISLSKDRDKANLAMDKGAIGVILISGEEFDKADELIQPSGKEGQLDIPVINASRKMMDAILNNSGLSIKGLDKKAGKSPFGQAINVSSDIEAKIELHRMYKTTANVIGVLEGSDPILKDEWLILGAHHDHLGSGGQGSSSRMPDTIAWHYGADDNASGVSSVLELAAYFSAAENKPRRSMMFITFGGEEMGLLGSHYFVGQLDGNVQNIEAMLNLDMVGRMRPDSTLQIGGIGTAKEFNSLVDSLNQDFGFNLKLSQAGYGPSDHASFYIKDVPVLFFTTGIHKDYHTPFDVVDSINFGGMKYTDEFVAAIAKALMGRDSSLTYTEAGPKTSTSRTYKNKITLGIMPDVTGSEEEGLEVLGVTPGKPAQLGGMQKGDIIVAIERKKIKDIYDYMYRLNSFKQGETIVVTVKRNNQTSDLLIQL